MPAGVQTTGISQGGILMSQTNTMTMGGGQITQNVIPPTGPPQQAMVGGNVQQGQINIQGMPGSGGQQNQMNQPQGGMMNQQLSMEMARQQNLMKIHQLQQTLEAAQQQEAQYKSQMEVVGNVSVFY